MKLQSGKFRAMTAWLFLAGAFLCAAKAGEDRVEMFLGVDRVGSFTEFQVIGDTIFLPLKESASALGIEGFADSQSKMVFFRGPNWLVVVDSSKRQVQTADKVTALKYPPIWTREDVFIPDVVYTPDLSRLTGKQIRIYHQPGEEKPADPVKPTPPPPVNNNGSSLRNPVDVIVIDPGHGGHDTGAKGPDGILEKDVTLTIARQLRDKLQSQGGVVVHLTRDNDTYVELSKRPKLAKDVHADVFISIHANGFKRISAQGFETFFASLTATDQAAMDLAQWENQAAENDNGTPDEVLSDLEMILGDMAQTESLADSQAMAEMVQEQLARVMNSENRGVKQAPFKVLMDSPMPAVLIEVGFLTSPSEARLITDQKMQKRIVNALATATLKYRDQTNARLGLAPKE